MTHCAMNRKRGICAGLKNYGACAAHVTLENMFTRILNKLKEKSIMPVNLLSNATEWFMVNFICFNS